MNEDDFKKQFLQEPFRLSDRERKAAELWSIYYKLTDDFDGPVDSRYWNSHQRRESGRYALDVYTVVNMVASEYGFQYSEFRLGRKSIEHLADRGKCDISEELLFHVKVRLDFLRSSRTVSGGYVD